MFENLAVRDGDNWLSLQTIASFQIRWIQLPVELWAYWAMAYHLPCSAVVTYFRCCCLCQIFK